MLHGGHRSCRRVGPNADSASEDGIKLSLQVVDFTRSHIRKHPQSASTDCSLFVVRLGPREASPQALEMAKGGPAAVTGSRAQEEKRGVELRFLRFLPQSRRPQHATHATGIGKASLHRHL